MLVFDQRQQERLEQLELEIADYVATLPSAESMDELKEELEHYGLSLGQA